jgi:gliding motility-associated-like protein
MRYLFFILITSYSISTYSQCFECTKNIGAWTDESAIDIERTIDGIVYLVDSNGFVASRINKYDFNCNLIWSKTFEYVDVDVKAVTSDELGNIYLVIHNTTSTNAGLGPWNIGGFMMSPGLNFYKLNSSGTILWTRHIGPRTGYEMQNIHYFQNQLFVTGTFYDNLTFSNGLTFNFPYTNYPRAFIAKYDTDGNFINAVYDGNGDDNFKYSEIDNQGNIYLTRSHYNGLNSNIDKFDSSLQLNWSKILSSSNSNNTGIYTPTGIKFNRENNKLYIWGKMNLTTTIMGNTFFVSNSNGIFQSALTELNSSTGNLENIKRFDNNSSYSNAFPSAVAYGRSAYMMEKNGYLYILTSFRNTINFPNGTVTSTNYSNGNYFSEDLLLFKMKLSDFTSELIFKSTGVPNLPNGVTDLPGPILFNGDDLYLTATFGSTPMQINGATINNNSGNNDPDAMYYKFNINSPSNLGNISVQNTCYNELTEFSLNGNYDSIIWNFGDPNSTNNSTSITSPQHLFSSSGNFHITATVTCGSNTQIVEKDIVISNKPVLNNVNPISKCETISGSGICSEFDTSNLNSLLIGSQQNVIIEYRNSNGDLISNPLPNPYTNITIGGDTISVKAYFATNPNCFAQTNIQFITLAKPARPTLTTPQTFCIPQNATLNDIIINGQNLKWYDSATAGNLLLNDTGLVDGSTYYVSQSNTNCESYRTPVLINIQNTPTPTGAANQTFCSTQNPTLSDIIANGTNLNWYNSNTSTIVFSNTTQLVDGATYYATQVINNCESINRLAVTVNLINTLNASDYSEAICDDLNDGSELINLLNYNANLISNISNCTFEYYSSLSGATNQTITDLISTITNYNLTTGNNTFFIRITSTNGCHQIVKLTFSLVSNPIIPINNIVPICENTAISINAGSGFNSYIWSTGSNSQSISISQAGNYSVTVTKSYGTTICSSTKNFAVVLSNVATITNIETQDWTDYENIITVNTSSNSYGNYEFSIDGINYQDSNVFSGLISGAYTVYVRDKNGCGIAKDEIFLLMYPKFFTPNGDGYNDTWAIKFSHIEPNLKVDIFDRYGKLLKKLNNTNSWDGNYNGNELPSTDYWFVVTRENGKEYRGHFTMKR